MAENNQLAETNPPLYFSFSSHFFLSFLPFSPPFHFFSLFVPLFLSPPLFAASKGPREYCATSVEAALHWLPVEQRITIQAVSVYALHPYRKSTKIPFRLCIYSFCSQWQIPAEVCWLSSLRSVKNKIWRTWLTAVQLPGTLFHPTFTTLLIPVHSENDSSRGVARGHKDQSPIVD